jgi:hypothetical protein
MMALDRDIYPSAERFWLGLSAVVIFLSLVMSTTPDVASIAGWSIPPLCPLRALTGLECPGCGMTRAFVFMGHAEFASAFATHKLGPALYAFVAAQVPWRVYRLWCHRHCPDDVNQVL